MVIYADILLLVNFIADYFLLRLTSVILRAHPGILRILLASTLASLTSLYIFLPQSHPLTEISVRLFFCFIITLTAFGFKGIKRFIRASMLFFGVTFLFAGAMFALQYIFKPSGMVINNSVVYFDVSPILLIVSSAAFYFFITAVGFFVKDKIPLSSERCEVILSAGENTVKLGGIIDTGNGITEPFSGTPVLLINKSCAEKLMCGEKSDSRFRVIPCKTVSGNALLDAFRLDSAVIVKNGKSQSVKNPVAAVSQTEINDNTVIINPDIFN